MLYRNTTDSKLSNYVLIYPLPGMDDFTRGRRMHQIVLSLPVRELLMLPLSSTIHVTYLEKIQRIS